MKEPDLIEQRERIRDLLLTPKPFIAWLEQQDPHAQVGLRSDCTGCPLHHFLRAMLPPMHHFGFTIQMREISLYAGGSHRAYVDLQDWAQRFIRACDFNTHASSFITASEALHHARPLLEPHHGP